MKKPLISLLKHTISGGIEMSENEFKKMCEIDTIAEEAGGYVAYHPSYENEVIYNYRAIIEYCQKRGIEPLDLTIREMQQFIVA